MSGKRYSLNIDNLVGRYLAGESEQAIANSIGCGRGTIRRRLLKAGIIPRGPSEAQLIRHLNTTPEMRRKMTEAAHDAVRGKKRSESEMIKRAIVKQKSQRYIGKGERILAEWLRNRGLDPVMQLAVGRYNIDIAILPIAVELLYSPGNPHTRATDRKKIKYLRNQCIHVLYVWINRRDVLTEEAADYIVSFRKEMELTPTKLGQYRVIRGSGELFTTESANLD